MSRGSRFAAPLLIALISYSVGKAGLHRLTSDMAVELRDAGVAVVAVWPPGTRTEGVLAQPEVFGDLSRWREPIFTGRVVAAFVATRDGLARTGEALVITDLACELGITPAGWRWRGALAR